MRNVIKILLLFLSLSPFVTASAQQDIKRDTTYRKDGTLWKISEYVGGKLMKRQTYENHKLIDITSFRDGEPYGWSESWDYDRDTYRRCFYKGWGSPRLIDEYAVWHDQKGLSGRTIQNEQGYKTHSFYKPDCDSTQTEITDTHIVLRDYKDGRLRSLEHYTPDIVPDGVFESYHPSGLVACRQLYKQGELMSEQFYDHKGGSMADKVDTESIAPNEQEPIEECATTVAAKVTKLTKEEYRELLRKKCESNAFHDCLEMGHDLVIRNAAGEVLLERHSTEEDYIDGGHLNFAYYGCDKKLGIHLGFSSYGDYNLVHFFFVREKVPAPESSDNGSEYLDIAAECVSIHDSTGWIAALSNDDRETSAVYNLSVYQHDGAEFHLLFNEEIDLVAGLPDMWWIGDNSLLVSFSEEESYRIDIDAEALNPELPEEDEGGDI